jgi:hypothetical protein
MNRRLARMLVKMYPRAWRERYGAEFAAMLEDGPGGLGTALNVIAAALSERVLPTKGGEMTGTSRWEKWGARAPWAVFGIAPMVLLAAAYLVSFVILWTGWRQFLPRQQTPFVAVDGWAIAYFSIGRLLYFFAPMLIGVLAAWAAVRARVKATWPVLGMAVIAWAGSAAQVKVGRPVVSEPGRVWMSLDLGHLGYAPEVLAICVLVYLLLRMRRTGTQAV